MAFNIDPMDSTKRTAKLAGVLYFILAITGMFSILYVPSQLIIEGDAGASARNIAASPLLYRTGIVSGLVCQTVFVLLVLTLYKLLRHVNPTAALAMLVFVVVSVPVAFVNSIVEYVPLLLLTDQNYLTAFTAEQVHEQISFFRRLYNEGLHVAGIFWGLWLFPLGYLVYKSGMFPKVFGIMLMIGCFGYLIDFFVVNFLPTLGFISLPGNVIATVAEFSFVFYLLIKGVKSPSRELRPTT